MYERSVMIELSWSDGSTADGATLLLFPLVHRTSGVDEGVCEIRFNEITLAVVKIQALEDRRTKTFLLVKPGIAIICFRGRAVGLFDKRINDICEIEVGGVIVDKIIWRKYVALIGRQKFAVVGSEGPMINEHTVAYVEQASLDGDRLTLGGENHRAQSYSEEYDLLELVGRIKEN
jgi:hypothetical protein